MTCCDQFQSAQGTVLCDARSNISIACRWVSSNGLSANEMHSLRQRAKLVFADNQLGVKERNAQRVLL